MRADPSSPLVRLFLQNRVHRSNAARNQSNIEHDDRKCENPDQVACWSKEDREKECGDGYDRANCDGGWRVARNPFGELKRNTLPT